MSLDICYLCFNKQRNLKNVRETKLSLNGLRKDIEKQLMNFDKDIKSAQRVIFKQKTMIRKEIKMGKDKILSVQIENEQNMEQRIVMGQVYHMERMHPMKE